MRPGKIPAVVRGRKEAETEETGAPGGAGSLHVESRRRHPTRELEWGGAVGTASGLQQRGAEPA